MSQYRRPSWEDLFALARAVAKVAHSGQTRKGNGEPYFNHVDRVGEYVREHHGLRAATIALLHDTIEDTTITANTLRELGFPAGVVLDVVMLTRTADESYGRFITRLIEFGSDDALRVKLADLADNLRDLDAYPAPDFEIDRRRTRYLKAENALMLALEGAPQSAASAAAA